MKPSDAKKDSKEKIKSYQPDNKDIKKENSVDKIIDDAFILKKKHSNSSCEEYDEEGVDDLDVELMPISDVKKVELKEIIEEAKAMKSEEDSEPEESDVDLDNLPENLEEKLKLLGMDVGMIDEEPPEVL